VVSELHRIGARRVAVRLVLSTVSLASAGDVLVARIETVGSIVAAFCAVGFFVAAAQESRATVVLGVLFGLVYLLLIIFVSAVAF
jgi:hypothetical protein